MLNGQEREREREREKGGEEQLLKNMHYFSKRDFSFPTRRWIYKHTKYGSI